MTLFNRGLSPDFIAALKKAYERPWWKQIVGDPDLFPGIRKDALNVYYQGNSLVRLSYDYKKGQLIGETHYKYLLHPTGHTTEIISRDGELEWSADVRSQFFLQTLDNLQALKAASTPYASEEKHGVHKILMSNDNIVDVEIAFGEEREEDAQAPALRMDFAALQGDEAGVELVFFEAKHMSNPELRASGAAKPKVVHQIRNYERFLTQHQQALMASYQRVCRNLADLPGRSAARIIKQVADGAPLSVSTTPRLVVFGFDEDQRRGAVWGSHRQKLIDALGRDRVVLRGNPAGFTSGICASSS